MSLNKYPKVVVLKKSLIGVAVFVVFLIMALILRNIYASTRPSSVSNDVQPKKSVIESLASLNDTRWYRGQNRIKPSAAIIPAPVVVRRSTLSEHHRPLSGPIEAPEASSAQEKTPAQQALLDAMKAPISSNQITALEEVTPHDAPLHPIASLDKQNGQDEKSRFLDMNNRAHDEVLLQPVKKPLSPFEIKAGSNIPGVLIGGINSDLPGEISAQVRSNVYDSVSGNYVLIPQGAKLQGIYDSNVAYAQQRLLVVWKRILFPNGDSLNLEGMPGTDLSGYAGFGDEVNNHYGKIFGSVILGSVISAGAQLSQPQNSSNNPFAAPSIGQTMAQSVGLNIANTTVAITNKNLGIQPTITIRPGFKFNIKVTKDLVFATPYEDDAS